MEAEVKDTCKSAERDLSTYSLSLYVLCASCVARMIFDHHVCWSTSLYQLSCIEITFLSWMVWLLPRSYLTEYC
jgi:hypothetical protein